MFIESDTSLYNYGAKHHVVTPEQRSYQWTILKQQKCAGSIQEPGRMIFDRIAGFGEGHSMILLRRFSGGQPLRFVDTIWRRVCDHVT